MKRIRVEISATISLRFRYDFIIYDFVTNRDKFQSVSSDQISPLCFLYYYILRAKSGRMKRIGIEISVTISLGFRYEFRCNS